MVLGLRNTKIRGTSYKLIWSGLFCSIYMDMLYVANWSCLYIKFLPTQSTSLSLTQCYHDVSVLVKVVSSRPIWCRIKIKHCAVWIRHMTSGFSYHCGPYSCSDVSTFISSSPSSSSSKCVVPTQYWAAAIVYNSDYIC